MNDQSTTRGVLSALFQRENPRRNATLALARIMSQIDMEVMPFDEGYKSTRRSARPRHVALGVWLIPVPEGCSMSEISLKEAHPAVTCDLRRSGIGVLTPAKTESGTMIVAVADRDEAWKFFLTEVRHQSSRPGNWFQIGLKIERLLEPDSLQIHDFRRRIAVDPTSNGAD